MSETSLSDHQAKSVRTIKYPSDFEAALKAYPTNANMSKAEGLTAWKKLSAEDRALVLPSIPSFIAYCRQNPTYRPIHFCRYLGHRRFEGHSPTGGDRSATWPARLAMAREDRVWSTPQWGPMPGQPGCAVPAELLLAGDGNGWREHERAA